MQFGQFKTREVLDVPGLPFMLLNGSRAKLPST
jgi:hypothetical protein